MYFASRLQEKLDTLDHVVVLADFAMAMKKKLCDINLHSFNHFLMKIGEKLLLSFIANV